jgi:hypothetical protein
MTGQFKREGEMMNQTLTTITRNWIKLTKAKRDNDLEIYRKECKRVLSAWEYSAVEQAFDAWERDVINEKLTWG